MIPEITKILYATDMSKNARHAFGYAASLANRYGATIVVLHVVEDLSPQVNAQVIDLLGQEKWTELQEVRKTEVVENLIKRMELFCSDMAASNKSCQFNVTDYKVRKGHPVEEILAESRSSDYDVIVMGTHGHGILSGATMGSTAMRIVRRSSVPVLVIRLPKA